MNENQNLEIVFFEHQHGNILTKILKTIFVINKIIKEKNSETKDFYIIVGKNIFPFYFLLLKILPFFTKAKPLSGGIFQPRTPQARFANFISSFLQFKPKFWIDVVKTYSDEKKKAIFIVPASNDSHIKTFDEEMIKKVLKILKAKGIIFACSILRDGKMENCESLQPS